MYNHHYNQGNINNINTYHPQNNIYQSPHLNQYMQSNNLYQNDHVLSEDQYN